MAKKENDNFDFDTEEKAKFSFDLSFLKNLTKQQKGIILAAVVSVVLVIAIIITCIALGTNSGNNDNEGGNNNTGMLPDDTKIPEDISSLNIASKPRKLSYYVGDRADYSGLIIYVKGNNGEEIYVEYDKNPEYFTITGFDSSAPSEEQIITVECDGKTISFVIKIEELPLQSAKLESIHLDPMPRTEYTLGEMLDLTDAMIVATYSDGSTVSTQLTMRNIGGFASVNAPGVYELVVGYFDDHGGYAETTFTINVTE